MDYLVRIFKSAANETRIRLLESLLAGKEKTLDTLAAELKLPYKTVSRNLKILEKAMLVKMRTWRGKVYYSTETSSRLIYGKEVLGMINRRRLKKIKRAKAISRFRTRSATVDLVKPRN